MEKLIRFLTHRITIVGILILIQLFVFGYLVLSASRYAKPVLYTLEVLSYVVVFFVIISDESPNYKIGWIIPILVAPIFGGFFYILFKQHKLSRKVRSLFIKIDSVRKEILPNQSKLLSMSDPLINKQVVHLLNDHWPLYQNTKATFIASGDQKLIHLLDILRKAEHYIFMEYFIVNTGQVWNDIYEVLKEKTKLGVKVVLIYDDFGSSLNLPNRFDRDLRKHNIDVIKFNPMKPRLNLMMNYRDHRKIVVVDGKYGLTGGMNIADEYMNLKERFGHWQDAAILLEGEAVHTLTQIFLQTYRIYQKNVDFSLYQTKHSVLDNGYVIAFADSPLDKNPITKHTYMQMIQFAKKQIIITTPYFIIDQELQTALKLAALSGVRVDIIVPGIPDKKYVAVVSEHYYQLLIGLPNVYIHKYKKGFIHSKILYVDDEVAVIGTTNFDFRSLYLHFENSVWLYKSDALIDMKQYLDESMKASVLLTQSDLNKRGVIYRLYQMVLVAFSHLL